jgi:hypothetical protein
VGRAVVEHAGDDIRVIGCAQPLEPIADHAARLRGCVVGEEDAEIALPAAPRVGATGLHRRLGRRRRLTAGGEQRDADGESTRSGA